MREKRVMWHAVSMWILGVLAGAALTVFALLHLAQRHARRIAENPDPEFSEAGQIFAGPLSRLPEVLDGVFPDAPARAYVAVGPALDWRRPVSSDRTAYYIRSVGKRGGHHRYAAELRVEVRDRVRLPAAVRLMDSLGLGVTRVEKSYGSVWLRSGATEDRQVLEAAIPTVLEEICRKDADASVAIFWHVPQLASRGR